MWEIRFVYVNGIMHFTVSVIGFFSYPDSQTGVQNARPFFYPFGRVKSLIRKARLGRDLARHLPVAVFLLLNESRLFESDHAARDNVLRALLPGRDICKVTVN